MIGAWLARAQLGRSQSWWVSQYESTGDGSANAGGVEPGSSTKAPRGLHLRDLEYLWQDFSHG